MGRTSYAHSAHAQRVYSYRKYSCAMLMSCSSRISALQVPRLTMSSYQNLWRKIVYSHQIKFDLLRIFALKFTENTFSEIKWKLFCLRWRPLMVLTSMSWKRILCNRVAMVSFEVSTLYWMWIHCDFAVWVVHLKRNMLLLRTWELRGFDHRLKIIIV